MAVTHDTPPTNVECEHPNAAELVDCLIDRIHDHLEGALPLDALELALIDYSDASKRLV